MEIGDKVKIKTLEEIRKIEFFDEGSIPDHWDRRMISYVGITGVITTNEGNFSVVAFEDNENWVLKSCELELIENNKKLAVVDPSRWNTVCKKCGSPAYQGFMKIECSKCEG